GAGAGHPAVGGPARGGRPRCRRTARAGRTGSCARSSPRARSTRCPRSRDDRVPACAPAGARDRCASRRAGGCVTEALRALAVLAEPPCAEHAAIAEALDLPPPPSADEHMAVLGFQLPPYASIYLGAEGMLGGEARDRVAGFWRAVGQSPPREPDHLSVLCAALAELADTDTRTGAPRVRRARAALYWEHIASWMPPFLAAVRRIGSPFYAAWAQMLDGVLAAEAETLGPLPALPLALRAV